jgi:Rps23 Pro-64 3,4-dihydroxylase Tpa1-like proline 4-hydroxylase
MDFSKWNKEKLHEEFKEAKPFSHLVLDHFLDDAHALLEEIKEYDPIYFPAEDVVHDTAMKSNKRCLTDSRMFGPIARAFVEQSRTKEMIAFLENITGIDNLEADPYLFGGGIHRTTKGGHLAIHADYNVHPFTKKHRRLNVILYLNPSWKPEDNGACELWDKQMTQCETKIAPIMNRLLLFRVTDDGFHGHPEPWQSDDPRYSIALYYFTKDRPEEEKSKPHMALWQHFLEKSAQKSEYS